MKKLKLISKMALSFKNIKDFDKDMQEMLEDLGCFVNVSRIYVFFNESKDVVSNTFEWCAQGIQSEIENLQKLNYKDLSHFQKLLKDQGCICLDDIQDLPKPIRDEIKPDKLKSIVIYPIIIEKEIMGFIGFNECRYQRKWEEKELELLNTASGIVASAYERKIFHQELADSETNFRSFFETIDDLFLVSDLKGNIIHGNKSVIDKTGYSLESLKKMNIIDLHPLDQRQEAFDIVQQMLKKEINYCPLEVESKQGERYLVETRIWFGKWDKQDCLYSVSKDITEAKKADEALKETEKRFFLALDQAKAGLGDYNIISKELFLSPMWKKILGYRDDEIENTIASWANLCHPDDLDRLWLGGNEFIHRLKHKDGSWRWILVRGGTLKDEKGIAYRWIGTSTDITQEREQAIELERFFSVNLDLLCIADMEGRFIKTNKAWEEILGYSSEELKGRLFLDFVHPGDLASTLESMGALEEGKPVVHFTNRYLSQDGTYRSIEWKSNPYGGVIYAAARDITDRIAYERQILEISNRDALTNVYNRRYIFERAEEIIEEHNRTGLIVSVAILDIDYFKKINDQHGHQAGDYILKEFTRIIGENLRAYDLLGRYGGEEFILILKNADIPTSTLIIERILGIIRKTSFFFNGEDISFTFSGGIANCAEINEKNMKIDHLVKLADQRMYKAKKMGRNKIVSKGYHLQ